MKQAEPLKVSMHGGPFARHSDAAYSGSPIEPVSRHFPGWWPACCRLAYFLASSPTLYLPLLSAVLPPGNCPYLTGTAVSCNGDTYLIVNGVARWA